MSGKNIWLGTLAAVLMLPLTVGASPLSYTYVDLEYYDVEIDGSPVNDNGWALGGSAQFAENFFFIGRYADTDDLERITAGIGAMTPLGAMTPMMENTSWYGVLSFEDIDAIAGDDNGFGLETGLRHALMPNFEVNGGVQYYKVDGVSTFDDEFGWKVGALYSFTENLGVKAGYNMVDDYEEFTVGGRFTF